MQTHTFDKDGAIVPIQKDFFSLIKEAMDWIGSQADVLFLGQNLLGPPNKISKSLDNVSRQSIIDLPVIENTQTGMALGLSLSGWSVVSIYPRWDFVPVAMDQIVNHLDKISHLTKDKYPVKSIILRIVTAGTKPLNPGPQHCQDYTKAIKGFLYNIDVVDLRETKKTPLEVYKEAYFSEKVTIIAE